MFWKDLCGAAQPEHRAALQAARSAWLDNHGGGDLPERLIPNADGDGGGHAGASDILDNHRLACGATQACSASRKGFRLKSKAFLLTFNSASFTNDERLWREFLEWIQSRVRLHKATQWSAAMEKSMHSPDSARVHLHVYFSWMGAGAKGVDQGSTDDWVFKATRPRVDCNGEKRGPAFWLKATQRGHFYCSVHKEGAVHTATNYPPWQGAWVPDASWVVSLYRQHKLGHDAYLRLSARLRDGHDRRKASVEAIRSSEASFNFEEERAWARQQLLAKAMPFKPLVAQVEAWRMGYEELEERYRMLVLHGPSRTGKSRLARSLFGLDRTLVVDVQHAQHPDLHGFRRHEHLAILLDEVQDPAFIVNNKKLLQAHVDGAILGQSATQMFTYEVFLWRVPIILTTNNWHLSGMSAADLDWIGANCVVVHIAEPVYACSRDPGLCPELFHQPRPRQSEGPELPAPPNRRRLSKSSSSQARGPKRAAHG